MARASGGRDYWVDYAKALGIILVVYGHVARGDSSARLVPYNGLIQVLDSIIYSFHMPLFFIISGLYFKRSYDRRTLMQYAANKVDVLVYPYVTWSLIQISLMLLTSRYTNYHLSAEDLKWLLITPQFHFWFLYVLFAVSIIVGIVYRFVKKASLLALLLLSIIAFISVDFFTVNFLLGSVMRDLFYFAVGVAIGSNMKRVELWKWPYLAILFALAIAAQWYALNGGMIQLGPVDLLRPVLALSGSSVILGTCVLLRSFSFNLISLIGRHSISIYLAHVIVGSGVRIILHKLFGITNINIHIGIGVMTGIVGPLLFAIFVERRNWSWVFSNSGRFSLEKWVNGRAVPKTQLP